jgi:hypothetical protein
MADKFLNTGGSGNSNISNGTATIFGATIGADNLDASRPIKTNSTKQLISTNLDISDINSLQTELEVKPNLTLTKNDTQTNPATNGIKIYAKLDGNVYKRDSAGVESGFGGASDLQAIYDGSTPALITTTIDKPLVLQTGSADTDELITCSNLLGTQNFTVKADGDVNCKKVKSTTGNVELNLNDNVFTLTSTGNNILNSTGYTQIVAGTTLDIEAVDAVINGRAIITTLGGNNLTTTLTTTQTSFTNNQELITKKYVDDNNTNDPKTQNISATETNSAQTLIERNVIFGTDPMEVNDRKSILAIQSFNTVSSPETQGFSFTIPTPIIIKSVLFYAPHWGSTDTLKEWKLWRDEGRELLKTVVLNKLTQVGDYYHTDLATPFILSAGNYRCGLILNNGDKKHNYSNYYDFFDPFFTIASGVYTGIPDPAPSLEYPSGGSNNPASAILFDILNDFDNKGTTNLEQETKIQSAKIGYNFDNYYLNGVGDGTVLYGNPTETGTVSYDIYGNQLNLGGGGVDIAGKVEYSMLNLYQAGKSLQFDVKFRFAPWSADGPFISWDFGIYRFQYNNNETTGNSNFEIFANSVSIHTTTASIPYTSNYTELTLSLIFDVDTQTFTCFSNGTSFFTFIDTTPRTPTTAQKNYWTIQGGGQNGGNNETRIYSMKVYNPADSKGNVEITPTEMKVNSLLAIGDDAVYNSINTRTKTFATLSSNGTFGYEFDINANYYFNRVKISKDHISSAKTIYFKLYKPSDNTIINTLQITTNFEDANYYYYDFIEALGSAVIFSSFKPLYKWSVSVFLTVGDKIQVSGTTTPNPLIESVVSRTNSNTSVWTFPTTIGLSNDMPVIEFDFSPFYTTGTKNITVLDIGAQNINVSGKISIAKNAGNFTDNYELVSKLYVDNLLTSLPSTKRVRIPKTPDRLPTTGNAVYEDEYIRLGWDQATASDLEIQRTPASPVYNSICWKVATIAEFGVDIINADTTYTLNNFGFVGGESMECKLAPFDNETAPAYHISIFFTESTLGADDKLDWVITRYNIST